MFEALKKWKGVDNFDIKNELTFPYSGLFKIQNGSAEIAVICEGIRSEFCQKACIH